MKYLEKTNQGAYFAPTKRVVFKNKRYATGSDSEDELPKVAGLKIKKIANKVKTPVAAKQDESSNFDLFDELSVPSKKRSSMKQSKSYKIQENSQNKIKTLGEFHRKKRMEFSSV